MTIAGPLPSVAAFWHRLREYGDSPALVSGSETVSYGELHQRVEELADRLGTTRRLVLLQAANDVDTVVGYLACLVGGHPVLLAEAGRADSVLAAYDPDVVLGSDAVERVGLLERRSGSRHALHPDLAALLSTSGSTGSPKLVRLSHTCVSSNAEAIAACLGVRPTDVAATTLPLHYCYGLSVLTSHLAAGAAVLLTDLSVLDPCFWKLVRSHGVTTFPGVPHTFALLDRIGFESLDAPSLRYLTCAGGRLDPGTVRRYAALGRRKGFDLFVMYGATEATARMACLPPDLALTHPASIGVPIPGGSLSLSRPSEGELVYRGDNVMLGYAETPADLARGRDVTELRTGDLARQHPDGTFEIVGRLSRFAKVFGLRIDLGRVEEALLRAGVAGYAADAGDRVVVAVDRSAAPVEASLVCDVLERLGVPSAAVDVVEVDAVPRLASGKPDYAKIRLFPKGGSLRDAPCTRPSGQAPAPVGRADVAEVFAKTLGRRRGTVQDTDSFVSLGGDSLSYVETSLRLEAVIGRLPMAWHTMTVAELTSAARADRRHTTTVETNVILRAAAIVLIVGSHANLFALLGGAHVLVGLAGYNFGRFQLTDRPRRQRLAQVRRSLARIVVPSMLWLTFAAATSEKYGWRNVLLLNGVLGSRGWTESWHYWFVEALVWTLAGLGVLLAIPAVDRLERRHRFWFPMALAAAALLTRYDVVRLFGGDYLHRAHVIFWLFALGWAAVQAPTWRHRVLVSAVTVATVPGFFPGHQHEREALIAVGMLLLIWLPAVRVPTAVARAAGVLASASLYIYLCHWQIYPAYQFRLPWLATLLSLSAGVCFWVLVSRATPHVERAALRGWHEIRENRPRLTPRRWRTGEERPAAQVAAVAGGAAD